MKMRYLVLLSLTISSCMSVTVDEPVPNMNLSSSNSDASIEVIDIAEKANCREARKIDLEKNYKKALSDLYDTGRCYTIQKKYPLAMRFFNLVLSNSKDRELTRKTHLELAHIKLIKGHDKEAMELMRKSQKTRKTIEVSYQMSEIYLRYGAYDRAINEMSSFAGLMDNRVNRVYAIANLLKGQITKSIGYFDQIQGINNADSNLKLHYAWALTISKKYQKAKALMGQVQLDSKSDLFELKRRVSSELEKIVIKPEVGDENV